MTDEKKNAISVLRAIIISSPQRGKTVRELLRDYRDLEGRNVEKFGHRSIEDFLREAGEFVFEHFNGELIVHEKPNEQSLHIAKLVAEQNKPKKRSSMSYRPPRFVRPAPRNFVPNSYPSSGTRSASKSIFPRRFGDNLTNAQRSYEVPRRQVSTIPFSFDELQSKQMAGNNVVNNVSYGNRLSTSNYGQAKEPFDLRDRLNASKFTSSSDVRAAQSKPEAMIDLTTDDKVNTNDYPRQTAGNNKQVNPSIGLKTFNRTSDDIMKAANALRNTQQSQNVSLKERRDMPTISFSFEQLNANDLVKSSMPNTTPTDNVNHVTSLSQSQVKKPVDLRDRLNAQRGITANRSSQNDLTDRFNESNGQILSVGPKVTNDVKESSQSDFKENGKQEIKQASAPIYPSGSRSHFSYTAPITKNYNPFFAAKVSTQHSNGQLSSRIQNRLKDQPKFDVHTIVNRNASLSNGKKTVNDRFAQARLNQNSAPHSATPVIHQVNLTKDPEKTCDSEANKTKPEPRPEPRPEPTKTSTGNNPIESLLQYCKDNRLDEPKYKIFKVKPYYRFQCHVTINEIIYSTYPTDYKNENEARFETAKYALNRLIAINKRLKYPTCLDEDVELVIKIYNCLKESPGGVFYKRIPETFQTVHQQSLPVEWEHLIENNPKLFTIDNCINDKIVYIVEENEADKIEQKIDKLMLPWEKTHWALMVTCIVSTVEIWGRLIHHEYRHHFDSLINDVEKELVTSKKVAKDLKIGKICLVSISGCVYRVRIEKVDQSRKQCLCFFVDEGDQRWFDMSDIFICQNKFAKYPAQAIRFALYGLEDFAENEFARPNLDAVLLDRPLIGEIFTKEEDFIRLDESDDMEPIIQVVFYDTSTEDDINLNPLIVEKICSDIPAPKLLSKLTPVYISHIADNGDVYCQLQVNGMHYVNKLMRKLTHVNNQCGLQAWDANDSANRKLFLVFDEATSKWCRASLLQKGAEGNTMFFIDYGRTEIVPLSKIFCADTMSQALLSYPPQAVRTKLYGIDDVAQKVSLLRGFFNPDTLAYMKMCTNSEVPEVNLYHVKDSLITNIKDSFDLEREFNLIIDEMAGLSIKRSKQ